MSTMATLETLNFDNLALKSLPIDPEEDNFIRQVKYIKHRSLMQISHTFWSDDNLQYIG